MNEPKTMDEMTPVKDWWLAIPAIGALEELFGTGKTEYAMIFDPQEVLWLWEGGFQDCIVRKNHGAHADEMKAKQYTGWMFLVFGDGMRALKTIHETKQDRHDVNNIR